MDTSIITGIISGVIAIVVCLINNHYQAKEAEKKHEANIMLISYRLEQLEKEVAKNNGLERTYALERRVDHVEDQLKHMEDDLK